MWWLVVAGAALADPLPGDVVAERDLAASPEAIYAEVSDLARARLLFPSDCVSDWELGTTTTGIGATAKLVYHAGPMHRELTATLDRLEPHWLVVWDHPESLGFELAWKLDARDEGGTHVTLETPLNPPPWPLKKVWKNKIHPAWSACYVRVLDQLAKVVDGA